MIREDHDAYLMAWLLVPNVYPGDGSDLDWVPHDDDREMGDPDA